MHDTRLTEICHHQLVKEAAHYAHKKDLKPFSGVNSGV
jgi:hypothetical protein